MEYLEGSGDDRVVMLIGNHITGMSTLPPYLVEFLCIRYPDSTSSATPLPWITDSAMGSAALNLCVEDHRLKEPRNRQERRHWLEEKTIPKPWNNRRRQ